MGLDWAILNCLDRCKAELLRWNKEEFGNVGAKVKIELNFGWIGRMRCGGKGLGKIGFKVVIGKIGRAHV